MDDSSQDRVRRLHEHLHQAKVAKARMDDIFKANDKALEGALDRARHGLTSEDRKAGWKAVESLSAKELNDLDRIAEWLGESHETIIGEHLENQG